MAVSKLRIVMAGGLAAAVTLAGCGGTSDESASTGKQATSIKFVAAEYSPKTAPYWKDVASKFKAKTGITVNVQVIGWSDIHQQVTTMVQTNQLPDLLNLDSFAQYAADDLLWKASDIETPALAANLPENLKASGSVGDTPYAIPLIGSSSALFYNTDLFKKAGITGPPATLEELSADAKAISKLPKKIGFAVSLGPEAPQIDYSMVMFNSGGGYRGNGKWTINSDANVRALQWIKGLAGEKATEVNPGKTGRVEGTWQLFESGAAGMTIGQGGLADRLAKTSTKYKIAPFPAAAGVTPASLGIADYVMAFKKDGNQEAVKKFLDFAYAKGQYSTFIANEGLLPVTKDVQQALADDPKFGPYITALESAKFLPVGEPSWDKVLGEMKNSIGLGVQDEPPAKVLGRIQAVAESQ